MHENYRRILEAGRHSHANGRSSAGIGPEEIDLARLYSYAYRLHTIGTFHATRLAIEALPAAGPLATAHRRRAIELLIDLASQGMDDIPNDFRAVISTFWRYDTHIAAVREALRFEADPKLTSIAQRFQEITGAIAACNGIHLTRDDHVPDQASFIVPSLGITIVPLVYGDHHSWNLAHLPPQAAHVPTHRHHQGVEIHLGYGPMRGSTILGTHRALVEEGYAMPIPPMAAHGYVNISDLPHHVPFIFGSLIAAGWGVFLDVEPQSIRFEELTQIALDDPAMNNSIYLEREIERMAGEKTAFSRVLIPGSATDRDGNGGLELTATRATAEGFRYPRDSFRAVSVVRGKGSVAINGLEQEITPHDHFGIPAGLEGIVRQTGSEPCVLLDARLTRATK
jgi:hypothetical protein